MAVCQAAPPWLAVVLLLFGSWSTPWADSRGAPQHEITVSLDPASGRLDVDDAITLTTGRSAVFRLAAWLTVESVSSNDTPLAHERDGNMLRLSLPAGRQQIIRFRLSGRTVALPEDGGGRNALAVSGAAGAFLPGYAAWLPLTDDDFVAYRITVSTPAPHRARATGRLTSETSADGRHQATFVSEALAEPPSLFAGPYEVDERIVDGIRMRTYLHAEVAGLAGTYLERSHAYLKGFSAAIGDYPYADFSLVSSPLPVGLGFPGIAYVGRRIMPLPFMQGRSLAHEVAHNWWGNGIGVAYDKGNWSEGLTTFMADYGLARDAGGEASRRMRVEWLRDYAALPRERDTAVVRFVSKRHDAAQVIGYNKVAFFFHMLSKEIGETAFAAGIRRFWQDNRGRIAAWSDIRLAFERTSGRRLDGFFEQWLARPGAPDLRVGHVETVSRDGGHRIRFDIEQKGPVFRLTLPVAVDTAAGRETRTVVLDRARQTFELTVPGKPRVLTVDPEFDVFRRLHPSESPPVLRDVLLSPDAALRVESDDPAFRDTAVRLAGRLLDTAAAQPSSDGDLGGRPLLVIGETARLAAYVARIGSRSPQSGERKPPVGGTAAAWTFRRPDGAPVLAISAVDAKSLQAVLRPLPHYRRRSFIVFDGSKAVGKGTWPMADGPLVRRFAD